jgi:hypothetical protein
MALFLVQSAIVLPSFGLAFALSKLAERLSKRSMSHLVRGIFTFIVAFVFLEVAWASLLMMVCTLSPCDL